MGYAIGVAQPGSDFISFILNVFQAKKEYLGGASTVKTKQNQSFLLWPRQGGPGDPGRVSRGGPGEKISYFFRIFSHFQKINPSHTESKVLAPAGFPGSTVPALANC